jgi:AcrR family transcriptional regulator
MGRPSLAETRREEILAAFERSLLRHGLAGTTVQAVAEEAGCQRTLINHYFGDMESLIRALLLKLTGELTSALLDAKAVAPGVPAFLDFLFRRTPSRATRLNAALRAPAIEPAQEPLARMYEAFASSLGAYLRREFPAVSASRCREVAFAVVCHSMSRFQLTRLGVSERQIAGLRSSAELLIDSLRAS